MTVSHISAFFKDIRMQYLIEGTQSKWNESIQWNTCQSNLQATFRTFVGRIQNLRINERIQWAINPLTWKSHWKITLEKSTYPAKRKKNPIFQRNDSFLHLVTTSKYFCFVKKNRKFLKITIFTLVDFTRKKGENRNFPQKWLIFFTW